MATQSRLLRCGIPVAGGATVLLVASLMYGQVLSAWIQGVFGFEDQQVSVGAEDLVAYWSAARLLREGANPYDAEALLRLQRGVGWPRETAQLIFNPPHTFVFMLPLSHLPFSLAAFTWLCLQLLLTLMCAVALGSHYGVSPRLAALIGLTFVPTFVAVWLGQISSLLLLGITAFLWAGKTRRDWVAGAALSLLTIKPHVVYLLLLAALVSAARGRRWRMIGGFLLALLALLLASGALRPAVFADYAQVMQQPPNHYRTATLAYWLQTVLNTWHPWLQMAPTVAGAVAVTVWLSRPKTAMDPVLHAPMLLLVSVLTAAYGWTFDQMVLVPGIVAAAAGGRRGSKRLGAGLLLTFVVAQVALMHRFYLGLGHEYTYWHPFVVAVCYHLAMAGGGTDPSRRVSEGVLVSDA